MVKCGIQIISSKIINTMSFSHSDGSLSSLTGSSAGRKSDDSLKLKHIYIEKRRQITEREIPPTLSKSIEGKKEKTIKVI